MIKQQSEMNEIFTALGTPLSIRGAGDAGHVEDHKQLSHIINNIGLFPTIQIQKISETEWNYTETASGAAMPIPNEALDGEIPNLENMENTILVMPNAWTNATDASTGTTIMLYQIGVSALNNLLAGFQSQINSLKQEIELLKNPV